MKTFVPFLTKVLIFSTSICCASFLWTSEHLALTNILLGVIAFITFLIIICKKEITFNFNPMVLVGFTLMLLTFFLSSIISKEPFVEALQRLNSKSFILTIPLLLMLFPNLSSKGWGIIILSLSASVIYVDCLALRNFYTDYVINNRFSWVSVLQREMIPFKIHHHTLAICNLSCAVVIGAYLYKFQKDLNRYTKSIFISMLLFEIVMANFTMARIAILAFITILLIFLTYSFTYIIKFIHFRILTLGLIFLFFYIIISFNPLAEKRIAETIDEFKNIPHTIKKPDRETNFGNRISAFIIGYRLIMENPWVGTGFKNENSNYIIEQKKFTQEIEIENMHSEEPHKPHLQFFRYIVIMGIPLGILFLLGYILCLVFPLGSTNGKLILISFFIIHFLYNLTDMPFWLKEWQYHYFFTFPLLLCILNNKSPIKYRRNIAMATK